MQPETDRPEDSEPPPELDRGLELGFGGRKPAKLDPTTAPSVIQRISEVTGRRPAISLRDADTGLTPMLKPLVAGGEVARETGKYMVHGLLGQGGVGSVHRGHDTDLGRDVAIKFLHERYASDASIVHRFVEEAQIGGQMQHPGIVPVYELGMADGRPFFTMKMVKGVTLAKKLADRSSPQQGRRSFLSIFESICQTMAYAHARGVVHRDLKPANVMIGSFGEVQVVDWGMGKVLQSGGIADEKRAAERNTVLSVIETVRSVGHGSQSIMGSVMGTPAYMPPEQARGDVEAMDERSDVFALGAILCEILTGQPPYVGQPKDLIAMAATVRLDDAQQRLAACGADAAIVELTTQCLMPAPAARPASAAEVAERVSAYLSSVEDRARQAELRATEARYRHRMTLLAAAGAVLVLALGVGTWLWLDAGARERRDQVMARVSTARTAASGALGQAEASDHDEQLWAAALANAEQVVTLCEDDAVDAAVRAEAVATLQQVQQKQHAAAAEAQRLARDAEMLDRLELLRIPADDDVRGQAAQTREARRLDKAYAETFASYLDGASLFDGELAAVLAALQRGDIEVDLATSLDYWGLVRDGLQGRRDAPDADGTARIRALAMQLDPANPWRTQLRLLLPDAAHEGPRLLAITEQADFATLSAAGCRVLAEALSRAGERDAAVEVLRRGQEVHPRDFDLCFALAVSLEQLPEPRTEEATSTYRVAHALRPEQAEVLHRQGMALHALGRVVHAERLFRMLTARDPNSAHWLWHVADTLEAQDKVDEGIACLRRAVEVDPEHPNSYVNLGKLLWKQNKLEEAGIHFRRAIELDPEREMAHRNLGVVLEGLGKLDEAIASYRRAVECEPGNAKNHVYLGHALRDHGNADEAISCLRRAIEIDPQDGVACKTLGNLLWKKGEVEEAINCYRRATEIDPKDHWAFTGLGRGLASQGADEAALACFRRAVELDPEGASSHYDLGRFLGQQGKTGEAIASFRRAIEIDPTHVSSLEFLGIMLHGQGLLNEAIACFRRAVELDPQLSKAHYYLGRTLADQGKTDEAIACLRRAVELGPKDAAVHYGLGLALEQQGGVDEAIASFRRAIEFDPQHLVAHDSLGTVLWKQGRLDEAVACFRRLIELDPQRSGSHHGLGLVLSDQGKMDEAIACLRRAVELNPQDGSAQYNLAQGYSRQDDYDAAIPCLRRAIEINDRDAGAHRLLGYAHWRRGELDAARTSFRRAIEIDPADSVAHFNLGVVLEGLGKPDEAIASYRRAIEFDPASAEAHRVLGLLRSREGELDEAIALLRRAVELDPDNAPIHFNLGFAFEKQGTLEEALASYGRALVIWTPRKDASSVEWAAKARQRIDEVSKELDRRQALLQVLQGERRAGSGPEFRAAAHLGRDEGRFQDVVAMMEATLETAPELASAGRSLYDAAHAAAMRATSTDPDLRTEERSRLRNLSLTWLSRAVATWREQVTSSEPVAANARRLLDQARQDPAFATLRGSALDALPEAERAPWREVWASIEATVQ